MIFRISRSLLFLSEKLFAPGISDYVFIINNIIWMNKNKREISCSDFFSVFTSCNICLWPYLVNKAKTNCITDPKSSWKQSGRYNGLAARKVTNRYLKKVLILVTPPCLSLWHVMFTGMNFHWTYLSKNERAVIFLGQQILSFKSWLPLRRDP